MKRRRRAPRSRLARLERAFAQLWQRVDRLEGNRRRIGFQTTSVVGDGIEQDDDDYEIPEET